MTTFELDTQVITDVRETQIIEIHPSDNTKSIFSNLKKAVLDRVAFR